MHNWILWEHIEEINLKQGTEKHAINTNIPIQILGYWVQFVDQYLTLLGMTWEEVSEEALEVVYKNQDPLFSWLTQENNTLSISNNITSKTTIHWTSSNSNGLTANLTSWTDWTVNWTITRSISSSIFETMIPACNSIQ